jgi:hypothetical protein
MGVKQILMVILCSLLFIALSTSAATKQSPQTPDNAPAASVFATDINLQQTLEFFRDRLGSQNILALLHEVGISKKQSRVGTLLCPRGIKNH